jgi:hypothetical protein
MATNTVHPQSPTKAVEQGKEGKDQNYSVDDRLYCEDESLFTDQKVINKLIDIVNQLGNNKETLKIEGESNKGRRGRPSGGDI